jgi:hypothetical protein
VTHTFIDQRTPKRTQLNTMDMTMMQPARSHYYEVIEDHGLGQHRSRVFFDKEKATKYFCDFAFSVASKESCVCPPSSDSTCITCAHASLMYKLLCDAKYLEAIRIACFITPRNSIIYQHKTRTQ